MPGLGWKMKPSKAAAEAAEEAFLLSACSFPDKLDAALRAAYNTQFGDETLYRRYPGSKPFGAIDPKTGAMAMWVVPVDGGDDE